MCISMRGWTLYAFFSTLLFCGVVVSSSLPQEDSDLCVLVRQELLSDIQRHGYYQQLMQAIDLADIGAVRTLIVEGCDAAVINSSDSWGPIISAAASRSESIMRLLLYNGGNPNSTDSDGWSALMYATSRGSTGAFRALLEKGADVNMADNDGDTALHAAVFTGHTHMIQLLIAAGMELDAEHVDNGTALEYACRCGRYNTIPVLMLRGARIPRADVVRDMQKYGREMIHHYRKRYRRDILQQLCPMIISNNSLDPDIPAVLCGLILEFINGDQCRTVSPCSEVISQ